MRKLLYSLLFVCITTATASTSEHGGAAREKAAPGTSAGSPGMTRDRNMCDTANGGRWGGYGNLPRSAASQSPGLSCKEAFEKAVCYVGIEPETRAVESVRDSGVLTSLGPTGVPFLRPSHSESKFWCFDFGRARNRSALLMGRSLDVWVESVRDTGLVFIRSVKPGFDPATYCWDTVSVCDSLWPQRQGYDGIPDSCPPISLSKLLATQPIEVGEPAMIDAICLIRVGRKSASSPAWVIVKHDCTTSAQLRSKDDALPQVVRHGYQIWDAVLGAWISSGNYPMYSQKRGQDQIGRRRMNW